MTHRPTGKTKLTRPTKRSRAIMTGIPLASVILATTPVLAEERTGGVLEEIVVTAQKREENLQNVPLSITALGTSKLEELHIDNYADYAAFLPSLSYQNGGQAGGPGVGLGEAGVGAGPGPGVGEAGVGCSGVGVVVVTHRCIQAHPGSPFAANNVDERAAPTPASETRQPGARGGGRMKAWSSTSRPAARRPSAVTRASTALAANSACAASR